MRRFISGGLAAAVAAQVLILLSSSPAMAAPYRAFPDASYWNKTLPVDAPLHANSRNIIEWLKQDNDRDYITIAGATSSGEWGQPIFWASPGDPVYDVVETRYTLPPEFDALRIPRKARPDPTVDAEVTIFDLDAGYVSTLHRAQYDAKRDTWSAGGAAIYYLSSNGIDGKLAQSNERRNMGHRGLPPSTYAVRYDEVEAGAINHVLKIAVNTTKNQAVFPMSGHENGTTALWAPPEGTRIRIKPSVNIDALSLSPAAKVVARAMQRYGVVIGDQSAGNAVLKLENTVAEGRGFLWDGVLGANSLSAIPFDKFEVVQHGYESSGGGTGGETVEEPVVEEPVVEEPVVEEPVVEEPVVEKPRVKVMKPRKRFLRVTRSVAIRWWSYGDTRFARIRYKVRGGPVRVIRWRAKDDGRFLWNPPRRLRGRRLHVRIQVLGTNMQWGHARSRWYLAR